MFFFLQRSLLHCIRCVCIRKLFTTTPRSFVSRVQKHIHDFRAAVINVFFSYVLQNLIRLYKLMAISERLFYDISGRMTIFQV